jgi:hypothetical protein
LKEIRAKMGPAAFANVEALTTQYPEMRDRVKMLEQRIAQRYRQSGAPAGQK